jgi:hypothetical protein
MSRYATYIASAVVANDNIDQRDKQIFHVFAVAVCEKGVEGVQNDKVLFR